jgi:tetratricopeptide (TPR) repeat protein
VSSVPSYGLHDLPQPTARDATAAALELSRLRSLGYVSGASAVTSRARVNLGEIWFRQGRYSEAIRELEVAVRTDPHDQRAALWLARAYAATNRADAAVAVYDHLIESGRGTATIDPIVPLAATDLDLARGRADGAAERLARLPPGLSGRPEVLVARAAVADAQHKPEVAERLYRSALMAHPSHVEALLRLVDLLIAQHRLADAAQVAGDGARRFPESAERQALVGETALADRRAADAARAFRQALVLAPDAVSVRLELARAELLQQHPDAALEAAAGLNGSEADVIRGAAQSAKRNWPAAVEAYVRAETGGMRSVDLLNALGTAQLEAGRPADAVATLERSLATQADQPEIRALLARARSRAVK